MIEYVINKTQIKLVMSSKAQDPIEYIMKSPLSNVLIKGFAQIYKEKPTFPIQYLAKWLKEYSNGQKKQAELQANRNDKIQKIANFQADLQKKSIRQCELKMKEEQVRKEHETKFIQKVQQTQYLNDLLHQYFPQEIQNHCNGINRPISGCYIGQLTFRRKKLEENNFEPNAEFDSQAPKVIQYVGASNSHKFIIEQILPSESGRSYQVFKEEEPPAQENNEEGKIAVKKKKYLYVPLVQRDQKINFFRFPRLGAFACFPLRVKSCLLVEAFDKGINDYKAFVKAKEEVEKEYSQKFNEAKNLYQQAKRKYQEHQGPQDDPNFIAQHANLGQQHKKNEAVFKEIQTNPPQIEQFKYETKQKDYVLCVDTMGLDSQIGEQILQYIDQKVDYFREKWEYKEYKMLLQDILQFIQEEHGLQAQDNYFKDQQRSIIATFEAQIKEQFPNRQKQAQFELTLIKCTKMLKLLQDQAYQNSLNTYLSYHLPKYKEIIQIVLMLLGKPKAEINLPRSNSLNHRYCIQKSYIQKMIEALQQYQLRRQSSQLVGNQYKINKLLERLQKIDGQAVGRYNSWLYALLATAKQICWARIQCRDAKIEANDAKVKAKNDRDAEIAKYEEQLTKNLEAAKAELNQETLPTFIQEDWLKNYANQNIKPEALNVPELKQFLDIQ